MAVGLYLLTITVTLTWAGSYHFVLGGNGSSTYNFGYDTKHEGEAGPQIGPRLMREETRLSDGTVVGRYGYTDPFGVFRQVEYVAGPNGYYAYEDVGGRGGTGSLPLFFKATARQRDAGRMAGLAVLSDKFNPPLYHPEAHLADDDTPFISSESSSTLNGDLARLTKIPSPILSSSSSSSSSQRRFNVERSVPKSPIYSSALPLSTSDDDDDDNDDSSIKSKDDTFESSLKGNTPEYRANEPVINHKQVLASSSSSSPKTAFQFDFDQQALKRVTHNNNDDHHLKRRNDVNDDLKELESYSLPTNFNVYKTDSFKPYSTETSSSIRRSLSSSEENKHFQLSDLPLSLPTSSSSTSSSSSSPSSSSSSNSASNQVLLSLKETPSSSSSSSSSSSLLNNNNNDNNNNNKKNINNDVEIHNYNNNSSSPIFVVIHNSSIPSSSSSSSSSANESSSLSNGGYEFASDLNPLEDSEGDPLESDSDIKILGSSLSASTSVVINDTFEGLRDRDASIPEVEILSTYGKRLTPRVDEYDAESFIHYGPRIVPTFFSDSIKDANYDAIEREGDPLPVEGNIDESTALLNHPNNNHHLHNTNNSEVEIISYNSSNYNVNQLERIETSSSSSSLTAEQIAELARKAFSFDIGKDDVEEIATTTIKPFDGTIKSIDDDEQLTTTTLSPLEIELTTIKSESFKKAQSAIEVASEKSVESDLIDSNLYFKPEITTTSEIILSDKENDKPANNFGPKYESVEEIPLPTLSGFAHHGILVNSQPPQVGKTFKSDEEDEFLRIINQRFNINGQPKSSSSSSFSSLPTTTTSITTEIPTTSTTFTQFSTTKNTPTTIVTTTTTTTTPPPASTTTTTTARPLLPLFSEREFEVIPTTRSQLVTEKAIIKTNKEDDHKENRTSNESISDDDSWIHEVMKRKSLNNNTLHRIEANVEEPQDPSKPKKRIIKLFYKKSKLRKSPNLTNSNGAAKLTRFKTVRLDDNHLSHSDKETNIIHKSYQNLEYNSKATTESTSTTTTTTIKPSTSAPLEYIENNFESFKLNSSDLITKPPKNVRRQKRRRLTTLSRLVKKAKLPEKEVGGEIPLALESRNNENNYKRNYVPPILGLMDDQEIVKSGKSGLIMDALRSSYIADPRRSSFYVPPIWVKNSFNDLKESESIDNLSNIYGVIAGSSAPLRDKRDSIHDENDDLPNDDNNQKMITSSSYLMPVHFWKRR